MSLYLHDCKSCGLLSIPVWCYSCELSKNMAIMWMYIKPCTDLCVHFVTKITGVTHCLIKQSTASFHRDQTDLWSHRYTRILCIKKQPIYGFLLGYSCEIKTTSVMSIHGFLWVGSKHLYKKWFLGLLIANLNDANYVYKNITHNRFRIN